MTERSTKKFERTSRVLYISDLAKSKGHIYRVLHNVEALRAKGFEASWTDHSKGVYEKVDSADVVIVFRAMWDDFLSGLYTRCRTQGISIGFDIDDLIFDPEVLTEENFDYLRSMNEKNRKDWVENRVGSYRQAILESDFAVVSTPPLAVAVEKLQIPVNVLLNGFDSEMMTLAKAAMSEFANKPISQDGQIRIGYASGSPTHQKDFATIAPMLCDLMDERSDVMLTIVGFLNQDEFPDLARHKGRIETRALVPHSQLLREYARFDINLAPLEIGNPFCEAKSALKYVEAALVGVPTVAAATLPYRDAIADGENGCLAKNKNEWRTKIVALLDDAGARRRLGHTAWLNVQKTVGPDSKCLALQRILASVIGKNRESG
jgi:glycosyltransferase involved in cell wall biosynthesis